MECKSGSDSIPWSERIGCRKRVVNNCLNKEKERDVHITSSPFFLLFNLAKCSSSSSSMYASEK